MIFGAWGDDDDSDAKRWKEWLTYATLRGRQEIGFFVPSIELFDEVSQTLQSPAACWRYIQDWVKLADMTWANTMPWRQEEWGDTYKAGHFKDKSKYLRQLRKVTPGTRLYENMRDLDRMYTPFKR